MSFPAYPEYKDSGVAWLGEVPSHWDVRRLKRLFELKRRAVHEGDGIVTAFRDGVVTLRSNRRTDGFTNAIHEIGYQGVYVDDLVIHTMDAFAGAIGVSDSSGKATPVYSVCTSRSSHDSPHFFAHLIRHMASSGYISALSKGIRERSTEFRWSEAGEVLLLQPGKEEQLGIVKFLAHETAKIDALIAEQEKLIELLKEKRQAVISYAVTKGLDPNVPMKDSGVEWLGQVPEHWLTIQLGRLCYKIADGPHFSPEYVDDGVLFISARNIKIDSWSFEDAKYVSFENYREFCKRIVPEKGDILYTKGGTTGVARVVDFDDIFQVWVHVAVLKIKNNDVNSYYLSYALNSAGCYDQSQLFTRGATNNDLGLTRMVKIWLALPPMIEQIKIVEYLNTVTVEIDALLAESQRAITLLKERRSALISAAVTGKIDVRGYAPQQEAV